MNSEAGIPRIESSDDFASSGFAFAAATDVIFSVPDLGLGKGSRNEETEQNKVEKQRTLISNYFTHP